jgi:phosphoribosylamine--glycine ligase
MKVLILGGGGREHALAWALSRSARAVTEIVCAPGNGGIRAQARCVPVDLSDLRSMVALAEREQPGLVVVGPELPLSLGVVDALQGRGFRVFGPTQEAAQLETSKAFAKDFMRRHDISTAPYAVCTAPDEVREQMRRFTAPVVVKADGLAAGKGVVIAETLDEAETAALNMLSGDLLGTAESMVVLEGFLKGEELSFFALCDGTRAVPIAAAQDHKRVGEGDTGPNTGGMGAYSTDALFDRALRAGCLEMAQRVVDGMRDEEVPFQGVLFCGIMMVPQSDGTELAMVLEFNTRWGDPETQAMLMRMETPVLDLLEAAVEGIPEGFRVRVRPGASVCVIAASGGYPGRYASGLPIEGLDVVPGAGVEVFHSGTAVRGGDLVTAGGRVLGVTAVSANGLQDALSKVYARLEEIRFPGMQYRRDIGWRALEKVRDERSL